MKSYLNDSSNYLESWSLGCWIVKTCQTSEELRKKLLQPEEIAELPSPSYLDIYKRLKEDWGHADALLSAFGI